jgi:hypothetical protein
MNGMDRMEPGAKKPQIPQIRADRVRLWRTLERRSLIADR